MAKSVVGRPELLGTHNATLLAIPARVLRSEDTATVDAWTVTPSGTITYVVFAGAPASSTSLPPVNVKQINDTTVLGNGSSGNKWRG